MRGTTEYRQQIPYLPLVGIWGVGVGGVISHFIIGYPRQLSCTTCTIRWAVQRPACRHIGEADITRNEDEEEVGEEGRPCYCYQDSSGSGGYPVIRHYYCLPDIYVGSHIYRPILSSSTNMPVYACPYLHMGIPKTTKPQNQKPLCSNWKAHSNYIIY